MHFWLRLLWVIELDLSNPYLEGDICRESEVVIIDAKTMAPEPVAVVKLPQRVPYGFHALFMSEVCKQLKIPSLVLICSEIHYECSRAKDCHMLSDVVFIIRTLDYHCVPLEIS